MPFGREEGVGLERAVVRKLWIGLLLLICSFPRSILRSLYPVSSSALLRSITIAQPTNQPTDRPTDRPTDQRTGRPAGRPTARPTINEKSVDDEPLWCFELPRIALRLLGVSGLDPLTSFRALCTRLYCLPTVYHLLSAAYCLLCMFVYCLLSTVYLLSLCLLSAACCLLLFMPTVYLVYI